MLGFFANIFGYLLKALYVLVGNYGIAIILFSVIVKLITMPLTIKQQKSMKKNEKMQAEMKKLQFQYKNDPEQLNREMMALYKREGTSPLSGCFSSIVQIILLLAVFLLVRSPLTYMVKMNTEDIDKLSEVVLEQNPNANKAYKEIAIIQYVKNAENSASVEENTSNQENIEENVEQNQDENNISEENVIAEEQAEEKEKIDISKYKEQVDINMDLFGIDLSKVPTQSLNDWKTLIIPILYVISSFASMKLTTAMTKKKKKEEIVEIKKEEKDEKEENEKDDKKEDENYNPMEDMSKTMNWMMPIMSVSIALVAPLGLALYWLANNLLMIVERLIFNKILKEEEAK